MQLEERLNSSRDLTPQQTPRTPDPTPEEIAAECAKLRQKHLDQMRASRGNTSINLSPRCEPVKVMIENRKTAV